MQQGRIVLCLCISNDKVTLIAGFILMSQEHPRSTKMAAGRGHPKRPCSYFLKYKELKPKTIHSVFRTLNQVYMQNFSQIGEVPWPRLLYIVRILQTIALKGLPRTRLGQPLRSLMADMKATTKKDQFI